jgi:L-alanine-DL-glutamate epimerase-like enolase superfamily enzyme
MVAGKSGVRPSRVRARAYKIPTDAPEADGTMAWDSTTLVTAHVEGGGESGFGYTYTHGCAAHLIASKLAEAIASCDVMDVPAAWQAMRHAVRNMGAEGIAANAISALDAALWDLKAKLLGLPLAVLLGRAREAVPIYGSGGFTTYGDAQLTEQLRGWVEREGCRWVKMKIGTHPDQDPHRVAVARKAIGNSAALFVDANGALDASRAVQMAEWLAGEFGVAWFEEPVTSDDLVALRLVRKRAPGGMEIAAGEYAYRPEYVRHMLEARAVDVQQVDATRCLGVTGFLRAAALCEAHNVDLSGHCAPSIHLHAACAAPRLRHLEWFHDHARIEKMLFDGAPTPREGAIRPDLSRPGLGIALKQADAEHYAI